MCLQCIRGAEIFLGASNFRDSRRILELRSCRAHSSRINVSRQTLRAVFFPAASLVRGTPNVRTIGDGNRGTWLAFVGRRRAGRFGARTPAGALRILIAVVSGDRRKRTRAESRAPPSGEWLSADDDHAVNSTRDLAGRGYGSGLDTRASAVGSSTTPSIRRISRQPY